MTRATCPECGEHMRLVGAAGTTSWVACDTCGLSWSEDELDAIYTEREQAAGDAPEPTDLTSRVMAAQAEDAPEPSTVTVPKAEWDALVIACFADQRPDNWFFGHSVQLAARALVKAAQR